MLFWENLAPAGTVGGCPERRTGKTIEGEYDSFGRFRKEFTQTASGTGGSRWALLTSCMKTNRLVIMQLENHNVNLILGFRILMAPDMWEHAYNLDYRHGRSTGMKPADSTSLS